MDLKRTDPHIFLGLKYNLRWSNGIADMRLNKAALALISLLPAKAMAYIDPGTGTMLLQVVLGGLAAIGVVLKLYWHKVLRALGFSSKAGARDEEI